MRGWVVLIAVAAEEMARAEVEQKTQGARESSDSDPGTWADHPDGSGSTHKVFVKNPQLGDQETIQDAQVHLGSQVDALIVKPYEDVAVGAMKHLVKLLERAADQVDFIGLDAKGAKKAPPKVMPMTPLEQEDPGDAGVTYVNFVKKIKQAVALREASHVVAAKFAKDMRDYRVAEGFDPEADPILKLAQEMRDGSMKRFGKPLDMSWETGQDEITRALFTDVRQQHETETNLNNEFKEWKKLRLRIDDRRGQGQTTDGKGLLPELVQLLGKFRERVESAALGLRWAQADMQEMLEALRQKEQLLMEEEFKVDQQDEDVPEDSQQQAEARVTKWELSAKTCPWKRECERYCESGSKECIQFKTRVCPLEDRVGCDPNTDDPRWDCTGDGYEGQCRTYSGEAVEKCEERCGAYGELTGGCSMAKQSNWNSQMFPLPQAGMGDEAPLKGIWPDNFQEFYGAHCPYGYMACDKLIVMNTVKQVTVNPKRNQLVVEVAGFNFPMGEDVHKGCLHAFLKRSVTSTPQGQRCMRTSLEEVSDTARFPDCHSDPSLPCNFAEASDATLEASTQPDDKRLPSSVVFYFEGPNDVNGGLLHGRQWATGQGDRVDDDWEEQGAQRSAENKLQPRGKGEGPVIFDVCVMQPPLEAPQQWQADHPMQDNEKFGVRHQPMTVFFAGQVCVCFVNKKRHIYADKKDYLNSQHNQEWAAGDMRLQPCTRKPEEFDASTNKPFCRDDREHLHPNNWYLDDFDPDRPQ